MTRLLDIGVEVGILAILLLSPLPFGSVLPWAQAGLEALVALTASLWVIRMVAAGPVSLRLTPLLWPGVAMLLLIGLQILLPGRSVSTYATWESFRLLAAYLAFLVVLGGHLVTPGRIVRLVSAVVAWGVALAAWGLTNQALGREWVLWFEKEFYRGRLVSTFVNANHQALYFAILLFLALGMLLRPSRRSRASVQYRPIGAVMLGTGPIARVLFGGAAVVLGVAVVLTASRGGVAAVLAGVLAMAVLALAGRVGNRVMGVFATSAAAFAGYVAWVGADRLLERLAVFTAEPFADIRWEIWRAALRMGAEAPILGVGLGAFEDAIIAHRPTGLVDPYIVDHAHNDYLQLLAEGGAIGVLVLGWAAAAWLVFVVGRWRDRQDAFVRGLVMGGLGAVTVVASHSFVDFGLRMPANALLLVAVLALLPAVVTLRAHRAGLQVDLREWRRNLGRRPRIAVGVATAIFVLVAGFALVPAAIADWKYQHAQRRVSENGRARGALTTADLSEAERDLRAAARLDPWSPRIQTVWADVAAELGHRVWTYGVTSDGRRLRPDTARERLAASQEFLRAAHEAYERSLRSRPLLSSTHGRVGLFLSRVDTVRRTVHMARLRDAVAPELDGILGSEESLLPRALWHLQEAIRLDPASPTRRLSLVAFALAHGAAIPQARAIVIQEAREAMRLERRVLPEVVQMLTTQAIEPDLLWHAVPRQALTLMELATLLEGQGRVSAAAVALEDAVAVAATPGERVPVLLARSRFLVRQGSNALALSQARQALTLAPTTPEVFAVLAEAYEANGQPDEAAAALRSALVTEGAGDVRILNRYRSALATLLTRQGDLTGALVVRRAAVQATPNDAEVHLHLARLLETRREGAEALREYETARGLAPDDSSVLHAVAGAFLRYGLIREAATATERALQLAPEDNDLRVELGHLYLRMGKPDLAREQYQQALARQPAHETASRGLRALGAGQNPG